MKPKSNKLLSGAVPALVGAGIIALNGMIVMSQRDEITARDTVPPRCAENSYNGGYAAPCDTSSMILMGSTAHATDVKSAQTVTALDITLPKHEVRKAEIGEYTMLMQIDLPADTAGKKKSGTSSSKKKKSSSAKKKEKQKETVKEPEVFDAVYKSDKTTIYDPKPDSSPLKKTRSVAGEYFNVFDERSGSYRTVSGHELLCQIINNEIGSEWGDEAIKAQTVAAYCHLRFCDKRGIVPSIGMNAAYDEHIEELVSSVEGQALYYDGDIINAVYSASTAGFSVESKRMWDMDYPYLKCVVSEYDREDPYYGLETVLTKAEVKSALESVCGIVMSDDAENWFGMEDIYSGRYVGYITIDGQKRITCRTLQDTFDLQSQAVRVEIKDDNVIFRTFGWGHGVGMSQWGSKGYAKHGWTYDQILKHYYVNTELKLSEGDTSGSDSDDSTAPEDTTDVSSGGNEEYTGLDGVIF